MTGRASLPRSLLIGLFAAVLVSCASGDVPSSAPNGTDFEACEDPRPEVCTREYQPVCGRRTDGTLNTYGNGCTACSQSSVVGYRKGACS